MPQMRRFLIPRGRLEDDDHKASALAQTSNFPSCSHTSSGQSTAEAPSKLFGPSSKLGNRKLKDTLDPWSHNAWDDVTWDDEQEERAKTIIAKQMSSPVSEEIQDQLNRTPCVYWDKFYSDKGSTFFKDRAWLLDEFTLLAQSLEEAHGPVRIAELGCGPGNTFFPLLTANRNPNLHLYGFDYSAQAVDLVKANSLYNKDSCTAMVWDITSRDGPPPELEPASLDIIIMIFVFSALHPKEWQQALNNLWTMLKPGGSILFRDYGRHDLTQLRMKGGRYMRENLYIRGDGTRVYFFDKDELYRIFTGESQEGVLDKKFEVSKLGIDKRLLLNRARQLKMYRVWLQVRNVFGQGTGPDEM